MSYTGKDIRAARDRIQHHVVAALAYGDRNRDPQRLVFKGGTMLRVCALPDYRYSEDLDFDWLGSEGGFHKAVADALPDASATSGAFLHLERIRDARLRSTGAKILWAATVGRRGAEIRTEATLGPVSQTSPRQAWPVRRPLLRTWHRNPAHPRMGGGRCVDHQLLRLQVSLNPPMLVGVWGWIDVGKCL